MVRIITGKYKGRILRVAKGDDVRPTADRVKETLFNILSSRLDFEEFVVLDLFAGTGSLGFEALSRGAKKIIFVDNSRKALQIIKENAERLNCVDKILIVNDDALSFIEHSKEKFDLIFADPPYMYPQLDMLVNKIWEKKLLNEFGFFSLEHDSRVIFTSEISPFEIEARREFGKTAITVFKYKV